MSCMICYYKVRTESRRGEVLEKNNPKRYDKSLWESSRLVTIGKASDVSH